MPIPTHVDASMNCNKYDVEDDNDAIVITGVSGRFPESSSIQEFKENLFNNFDMVTDDNRRWKSGIYGLPTRSGKLKELSKFDAMFFSVHAKQAHVMDPQLRLLLELTHETIIDAGYNPSELRGTKTGVFVGISGNESDEYWTSDPNKINGYGLTGCCRAMFPNRISYTFDFNGPSYAIDTACSSSMFALEQAFTAIRNGQCDSAIVGGVNLLLKPMTSLQFHRLSMLSMDGKCKAFDASGNGYVRAEAAATILLQKKHAARRIYSYVLNAKTNMDGYKVQGITFPSGAMQLKLIEEVYAEININPNQVEYVEAHGTGTKVGDPQEVNSIAEIFCKDRKGSLLIGSVKSNMGHSEPASGLCSIAKLLIAMHSGIIPANLHFQHPNTDISGLTDGRLTVVDKNINWSRGLVGVNSFGFGGANAHIILKPYKTKKDNPKHTITMLKPIALVSGRTEQAVKHFLENLKTNTTNELYHLVNKIHSINILNHGYRGFGLDSNIEISAVNAIDERPVWFVFSGMGTQWSHMARDMMTIPLFRTSIEKCAKVLFPYKINLMKILTEDSDEVFENVLNSFISIASIQIALTDILHEMKIHPDGIVGHSIGEIGCAYADQTFTTEQAILTAYFRGCAILDSKLPPGAMAAVGLSWDECKQQCPPEIQPACHNSDDSVTISGPPAQLVAFTEKLSSEGIFAKVVKSSNVAFHSKYIKEAGPKLRKALEKIIKIPKKRSKKWISSSIPQDKWSEPIAQYSSVDYHVNNLLSPVLFRDALKNVPENAIVIEIAPHCLLQAILKRSLVNKNVQNIGLMKRDAKNNMDYFLSSIGKLYNCGLQPDINVLYPEVSYPLGPEVNMLASMIQWDHTVDWSVPEFSGINSKSSEMVIEIDLSNDSDKFISGHQIDGRILFPATGYLTLIWKCFAKLFQKEFDEIPVIFNNVNFHRATIMPKEGAVKFLINIFHISGQFELCESGAIIVSGQIQQIPDENLNSEFLNITTFTTNEQKQFTLESNDIYKELRLRGYDYSNEFCGIQNANLTASSGFLKWSGNNWISFMDTMLQFSILGRNTRELYLPTRIQRVIIDPKQHITKYGTEDINIEVYMAHDINVIRSGAVEFRGMKASLAPRRQLIQSEPKLEKYEWIPYDFSNSNRFSSIDALTILLQIAIENSNGALKLKVMEILESTEESLMSSIVSILEAEPMIHVNGFIMNLNNSNKIENHMENVKVITKLENNCNLIINLNSYNVIEIEKCLKPGGMILTNSYQDFKEYQIMARSQQYYLLKKSSKINLTDSKIIYVNHDDTTYKWINEIKTSMIDEQTNRIFLITYNQISGIIGLINCLKQEAGGERLRLYFLPESNMKFSINDEQQQSQLELDLIINIYKGSKWGSYRHIIIDSKIVATKFQVEHAYINTLTRGDLSSLRWIEGPLSFYNEDNNTESKLCYVYYAPLNFRDIMLATGKLPPDALPGDLAGQDCVLGLEFSGRMSQNGERVMGMLSARGLATTVITDSSFLWKIPEKWSLEEAATIPIVYGTSYYALIVRGRMRSGESVLIHAGSGGVGQAAISIALHMKCTVFTTVGSQEKRDFLKQRFPQLTDQYIGNSRDCSFEQFILTQTHGRGVDLILNSLADDKLQASVRCLAKDGRFLEIGKVDLSNNSPLGMAIFLKNITFHGILLDALFEAHSEDKKQVMKLVNEGIENGAVQPLPSTVFHDNQIESAFRFMASGKHIGKVLIKVRDEESSRQSIKPETKLIVAIPKTYMNPEKSYILIGGLGGFGLELTNWMIKRGAKKLVLTSRSGIRTGYQALCINRWNSMGISIEISQLDCTKENQVQELLTTTNTKFGPIGGIFNLAAVLRDAMIDRQTEQDFKIVCEPKTIATFYLDKYSQELCPQLDYFVVFSSVSCGRGNAGQSNYGYANSVMERICEQRQLQGLPAKAIQWGAIGDVGLILDTMKGSNDLEVGGTIPQRINSCLETIDYFLQRHEPVVASMVLAEKRSKSSDKGTTGSSVSLLEAISNILGIKNIQGISMTTTLADLGMDSLMGSEIKQTLERNYDLLLNAQEIRNLTFSKLLEMTKNESENDQPITNGVENIETNGYTNGYGLNNGNTEKNIDFGISGLLIPTQSLVLMNACKSTKNILFLVHPIEGTIELLKELSNNMPKNVAVYGLQCTKEAPQDTINELAQFYVHQIQTIQAHGPYKLCGYSFGACVAFEMALQLQQLNETVNLVLLDGSHMYVTMHTQKSRKSNKNDTDSEQCEVLAYFVMQFTDFDAQKINKELLLLNDWDARATRAAEYVSKEKSVSIETIKIAALSFYKKLYAAECYKPKHKFNGPIYLIRAKDNYVQMADDYGLSNVCKLPIQITELEGNHRTILQGKSAQQITDIIMKLF